MVKRKRKAHIGTSRAELMAETERLQECIDVLSRCRGRTVVRAEIEIGTGGSRMIISGTDETSHKDIASLIASFFSFVHGELKMKIDEAKET